MMQEHFFKLGSNQITGSAAVPITRTRPIEVSSCTKASPMFVALLQASSSLDDNHLDPKSLLQITKKISAKVPVVIGYKQATIGQTIASVKRSGSQPKEL